MTSALLIVPRASLRLPHMQATQLIRYWPKGSKLKTCHRRTEQTFVQVNLHLKIINSLRLCLLVSVRNSTDKLTNNEVATKSQIQTEHEEQI